MRLLKKIFKVLVYTITGLIALAYITDYDYIIKGVQTVYFTGHTTAFIDDATYFENDTLKASPNPQPWKLHKNYNDVNPPKKLTQLHKSLGTVAFLVIKNDSILYEHYEYGYGTTSQTNSFSMAKSVTTALLGVAIKDGYIKSLDQPVADFYPQFNKGVTVGDLSSMASGLNWGESYTSPFSITARSYYDDDIAETILGLEITDTPGKSFTYLSGNTQLLGMVIEKATGKKIAQYAQNNLWNPMGFEQPATWQVDDAEHRLAKTYCCLASNARDFARFGKLFKDFGNFNGQSILDSTFVAKAISPRFDKSPEYGYGFWLSNHLDKNIFVMRGILGQYVITIPEDDVIIVRLGHQRGEKSGKPFTNDFYTYVEEAYKMIDVVY